MATYEFFRVEESEGVATVTLNRPPLNVLNIAMMDEFNAVLDATLNDSNLAALLIRAEGKAFCVGVDVADHTGDKMAGMIASFHGIFRKLASTDVVTIAAVQGAALGGGCELACFCDVILASDRAKFGQPEVQVGVFPPVAACVLPQQIGINKAVELNALGMVIGAAEAQRIGMVSQVYGADEFASKVDEYMAAIRKLSRPVVRMAKKATALVARPQILEQLERVEQIYMDELMKLSDAHEGIAAFMEKRTPNWTHA